MLVYCTDCGGVDYSSQRSESLKLLVLDDTEPCHEQFYCEEHANLGERYARFAFCKDTDTLRRAGERLQALTKWLE